MKELKKGDRILYKDGKVFGVEYADNDIEAQYFDYMRSLGLRPWEDGTAAKFKKVTPDIRPATEVTTATHKPRTPDRAGKNGRALK